MGHLIEKQGMQIAIPAVAALAAEFPDVELIVIGSGPYRSQLEDLARHMGVVERVVFEGYVESEQDMLALLQTASVALAPYLELHDSFTRYADPGKIKTYLVAGLPVVVTSVPPIARELEIAGCGVVVSGTVQGVIDGVRELFNEDTATQNLRRKSAVTFVAELGWAHVFDDAMASLLP
jgi:glycosyltransferase involved in cell wall biosynthesis